ADAGEFAKRTRSLARVAFFVFPGALSVPVDVGGTLDRYSWSLVSGDFFDLLGATPMLGRALRREDDVPGAPHALALSYHAWQDRFGGTPDIIGHTVLVPAYDMTFKIVGVMPQGLDFPRGVDAWSAERATVPGGDMTNVEMDLLGRLTPTASVASAGDELS